MNERVLYGTGMGISEILSLTKDDVDLKAGTVFVKQTKFGKERILPLAGSLINARDNTSETVLREH